MITKKKINNIKLFLTDCDGVLTNGGMIYGDDGTEFKQFNTLDGMAFKLIKKHKILTGIITGEHTVIVQNRSNKLQLDYCYLGVDEKWSVVNSICKQADIFLSEVLYVGDDINDEEVLRRVGISICPRTAVRPIRKICDYVTKTSGGNGVIREIYDKFICRRKNGKM